MRIRLAATLAFAASATLAAEDCKPGTVACEWHPTFEFAIQYDDRNQADADSSGAWLALDADGRIIWTNPLDWSQVSGFEFNGRDRAGSYWDRFLGGFALREGASIGIARRERGTRPRVAFTAGPDAQIETARSRLFGVRTWRITGLRRDLAGDVDRHRVAPPTIGEYPVWLLLPPLRELVELGADAGMIREELRDEVREDVREELRDEVREGRSRGTSRRGSRGRSRGTSRRSSRGASRGARLRRLYCLPASRLASARPGPRAIRRSRRTTGRGENDMSAPKTSGTRSRALGARALGRRALDVFTFSMLDARPSPRRIPSHAQTSNGASNSRVDKSG